MKQSIPCVSTNNALSHLVRTDRQRLRETPPIPLTDVELTYYRDILAGRDPDSWQDSEKPLAARLAKFYAEMDEMHAIVEREGKFQIDEKTGLTIQHPLNKDIHRTLITIKNLFSMLVLRNPIPAHKLNAPMKENRNGNQDNIVDVDLLAG